METAQNQTKDQLSFGPFRLLPGERLLTRDDVAVDLGARALDILIVLASSANEIVAKRDLMARVWPDVTVEEGSLRFHMNGLRRALGDGQDGARFITTLPGRGYCFVAPVARAGARRPEGAVAPDPPHGNLSERVQRIVGRDDVVRTLADRLTSTRFVTIVGGGGVGKTTVAVAVGHDLTEAFGGGVLLVDLGMVGDPGLAPTAVASLLGLSVQSADATPSVVAYLRDKRILLILDSCEHLVEAAADLASRILAAAPQAHILATSREALRAEGEHVYRLGPLACPPEDPQLTAEVAQTFAAAQLFLERAEAGGARLEIDDADAAIVAAICRRLDGVALAIELAARRVEAFGLRQTAALLDQRLALLWEGARTAPPRQKTLRATLDWSYELLSATERLVLRRLAVFVGDFPIDGALAVAPDADVDQSVVFAAMESLVAKSMVATRSAGTAMRYRLLDTTRAYVLDVDIGAAEARNLAATHAAFYRQWCDETGADWPILSGAAERAGHAANLNNVRVALDWAFGAGGEVSLGVELACAAAPVFLAMSLLPECHRWSAQAIDALAGRGGLAEMHLQAALGVSLLFMRGGCEPARVALDRAFEIAEQAGVALDQVRMLGPLHVFCIRTASFNSALRYARRCAEIAKTTDDPAAIALAHAILGFSLHQRGDLAAARAELEAAADGPRVPRTSTVHLGFEGELWAGAMLAKTLWLQGYPVQAAAHARQAVDDAARMDHSLTLSIVLIWSITVFLYTGDLDSAEEHIDWLIARGESHSMAPYVAVGQGFRGALAILRGDADTGVADLQAALHALHAAPYELLSTPLTVSLIEGLAATARNAEGLTLTDETIARVEQNGDEGYLPELLRQRGRLLRSMGAADKAEACLAHSLDLSRRQGARAWELRAATDLASLWAGQGLQEQAHALLRPLFDQFNEGAETADLKSAERLLASLIAS